MTRPLYESSHDRKECPTCNGEGATGCPGCGTALEECKTCKGLGWVRLSDAEKEAEHGQRNLLEGLT